MNTKAKKQAIDSVLVHLLDSRQAIKKKSSSFYFAFSRLPRYQAFSIFVLYDFLRQLDDAADTGNADVFNALVNSWQTAMIAHDIIVTSLSTIGEKLAYIFHVFDIDAQDMLDMIAGQKSDLNHVSFETVQELEVYCYQVAGTVGCMIYTILSGKPIQMMKQDIINVGIALQLTNIIRDFHEDLLAQRCFIPKSLLQFDAELSSEGIMLKKEQDIKKALQQLSDIAISHYNCSSKIIQHLDNKTSQFALELSIEVYKKILLKMIANKFELSDQRVFVTRTEKIMLFQAIAVKYIVA
ncbi:phytoene/squalene synthase family protein [Leuconostoc citreum]|uniref:phytoene/squalene synthase family protein n=1 Tax=Leuconostoc citreum TaxID=33964 RepID=UPI0032E02027